MKRIPSLDGVRAVSIALVILCHFGNDMGFGDPLKLGSLGVRIFFVISGFLITGLLLAELDSKQKINLPHFYFRRTRRIFPPFYFYLAVMLAISSFGWSSLTWEYALPSITYTSNYFSTWDTPARYITSHTWSLSTEEQFYLIWPLALNLLGRRGGRLALIAIVVVSPVARSVIYQWAGHETRQLSYFHLNADHLATGCLLAFEQEKLRVSAIWRRLPWFLFATLPFAILGANALSDHPSVHLTIVPTFVNFAIAACLFWVVTNPQSRVGTLLNLKFVAWIGVLSYSLYIWQQPFLHLHDHPVLLLSGPWRVIASPPVSLTLMMLSACASYYCIERPALRLRARLERRFGRWKETLSSLPTMDATPWPPPSTPPLYGARSPDSDERP